MSLRTCFLALASSLAVMSAFAADGDLDTTYNSPNGYRAVSFGASDNVYGGVLQPDGKLIVIGGARPSTTQEMSVARFNADGTIDTTFGGGTGKFSIDITVATTTDRATGGGLQNSGKIIIGGYTRAAASNDNFCVIRLNDNGTLDTTFGSSGIIQVDFNGGSDRANDLIVLPDDSIIIAGWASDSFQSIDYDYAVAKLTPNGALDTSFDTDGKFTFDVGNEQDSGNRLAVQPDGKILLAGQSFSTGVSTPVVARINANGGLDTTFGGGDGLFNVSNTSNSSLYTYRDVKVQSDGKIMVVGDSGTDSLILRLTSTGALDTSFNTTGYLSTSLSTGTDFFTSIVLQTDGKYVVGGVSQNGSVLENSLARFTSTGGFDSGFGTGGIKKILLGSGSNRLATIHKASDGKILASLEGGTTSNEDFIAARFLNTDTPPAPTVTLSASPTTIAEAAGVSTVTATLSAVAGTNTVVTLTPSGTAIGSGTDYTLASTTITINAGSTTGATTITAVQDTLDEADETVILDITGVTGGGGATESGSQQATITITDDDPPPTLAINDVTQSEGNVGTSNFVFTVTLSTASGRTVTVNYATGNGTATTSNNDYTATSGILTFAPGEITKTITVTVNGDFVTESNESFTVDLSSPSNATLADSSGTGTIINDDIPPNLTINDVNAAEGNSGTTTFTFTVSLSQAALSTVTFDIATADGTATTAGSDYTGKSLTSQTITAGNSTYTFTVNVHGDTLAETDENFFVNVTNVTGAVVTDGQGLGTISNDDSVAVLSSGIGDVVTGAPAPDASGAVSGTVFNVLSPGGLVSPILNNRYAFLGTLAVGTGGVTADTAQGLWSRHTNGLRLLARAGSVAPGTGNALFDVLSSPLGVANSGAEVIFRASLRAGTGSPAVTTSNDTGLWTNSSIVGADPAIVLFAREGSALRSPSNAVITRFYPGHIAITGTGSARAFVFYGTQSDGKSGIYVATMNNGNPQAAVTSGLEGSSAPGASGEVWANFFATTPNPVLMDPNGNYAWTAKVNPSGKMGLWYAPITTGTAQKVSLPGDAAPGTTTTFKSFDSLAVGNTNNFAFRGVLHATGDNATDLRSEGVWTYVAPSAISTATLRIRRGDTTVAGLPGGSAVGRLFTGAMTFGNRIAWLGEVDGGADGTSIPTAGDLQAIYSNLSGTMTVAVKQGDAAPGISGATFATLESPVLGGTAQMAFLGTVTGGGAGTGTSKGLWCSAVNGGSLGLGLRTGSSLATSQGTKVVSDMSFPGTDVQRTTMDASGAVLVNVTFTDGASAQVLIPSGTAAQCPAILAVNPATTTGVNGTPFSQTFTQTGGATPVTYNTTSLLPAGLTLAPNGTLSGTPLEGGTFPIVVNVTDSAGCTAAGATYTLVLSSPTAPEMDVRGNSISIAAGASTPGTSDHTDFGSVNVTGATQVRTFTIANTGTGALFLRGTPKVVIGGAHAAEFTVTTQPTSPVAATTGTTTFQITFDPAAAGLRTATVSIDNSDANENPYNFSIQGTGNVPAVPEIGVYRLAGNFQVGAGTLWDASPATYTGREAGAEVFGGVAGEYLTSTSSTDITMTAWQSDWRSPVAVERADDVKLGTTYNGPGTSSAYVRDNVTGTGFVNYAWRAVTTQTYASTNVGSTTTAESFTIHNAGTTALTLNSVTLAGSNPGDFVLDTTGLPGSLAAGQKVAVTVAFRPVLGGLRSATLRIISNDPDEATTDIALSGTGLAPEINLQGNSVSIANNDTTPSTTDHTDFGSATVGVSTVVRTYTVQNTGTVVLNLSGTPRVAVGGTNASDFTVTIQPGATVASAGSTTFAVAFSPSAVGTRTATLSIANNDSDENPYTFAIQGTGTLPQADLAITCTNGVTTATAGGSVTYTITASNAGPHNVTNAILADTFPAPLTATWIAAGAGGGTTPTPSGSGNLNQSVNLPVGGSVTFTVTCSISPSATGTLVNTATIAVPSGANDPTPGNNSATDTDTIVQSANLAITCTDGVATATPGGTVTYTIIAYNAGPSNASGATVACTFPDILTDVTWSGSGAGGGTASASGSGHINDTVNLPVGGTATYTVHATINPSATGTLSTTATVAAPAGVTDLSADNNSATDTDTLAPSADLAITVTDSPDPVAAGTNLTYTITATNSGPSVASNVSIAGTLPAGTSLVSVTSNVGTAFSAGSNYNFTHSALAPGDSAILTVIALVDSAVSHGSELTNTAIITSDTTDPTPGNNSGTASTIVMTSADLAITKTDGVTVANAGGSLTYTITASNAGPSAASTVSVADTFPAVLTGTWTAEGAGGATFNASGSGNINETVNLPVGGSVTFTVNATVAHAATGTLSNTATVALLGGGSDPSPGNNSATDTDTVNSAPTISDIANLTIDRNTSTGALPFTIGDAESTPGSLTVTATSSNTFLVPNAAIVLGGSGANRTVSVTPAVHEHGTTTITVTVSDGGATTSDTFLLTVNAVGPEITVEEPIGIDLRDGNATTTFEPIVTGSTAQKTYTIRNDGTQPLTGLAASISGSPAFTLGALGANTLAPGATTTFTITFAPTANGISNGFLVITSNDVNEAPFNIAVVGTAYTASGRMKEAIQANNGTVATATPLVLTPGGFVKMTANLYPNGDVDFFSFTATAGDRIYAATMTAGSAGNSTDSQLTLLDSDGTTIIEFDDDNGIHAALSSSISGAIIPATGTYFLKVNDFTANTTSMRAYDLYLQVRSGTPTAETEPNDTPGTANAAGNWISGSRDPATATEQDWYAVNLNAGDTVFLSLDLDPEDDGVTWNGRLGFALFGDSNNQILPYDDAGTGDVAPHPNRPSEAAFLTVKEAGTYYAFVDSASAAAGGPTATYHLSISVLPKAAGTYTTYTSTDVPKTIGPDAGLVSSTITIPGNPRIEDIDVEIKLNHALMQDIDAHLRSPAGNNNGLFTDIGSASTGGQAQMDLVFDDDAAIPPLFAVLKGLRVKPENNSTAGTASTSGAYRLAAYYGENAGGTWTLDLRDDTGGVNGGTLTSWSIHIREPDPLVDPAFIAETVFSTDFESGAAGFTHSGTQDEWELGLPATVATTTANPIASFNTAHSGVNCWKTDLDNTYNSGSNQDLYSPNIDLTAFSGPVVVTWAMRHQIETANFDHMWVEIQEVGGASTSMKLYEWMDPTPISASAGTGNPQANIGGSYGWGVHSVRADAMAGKVVRIRFHLDSDSSVNFGGLAVDDVSVVAYHTFVPEIAVTGNGVEIADGDTTPDLADHTDFGSVTSAGNSTVVRTFTIANSGNAELNLTGTPMVAISGANASDFTVTTAPTSPVADTDGTTAFQVTFNPSAVGLRTATVTIASNDYDEGSYTFDIQGTGLNTAPAVVGSGIPDQTVLLSQLINVDLSAYFEDVDLHSLSFSVTGNTTPARASATLNPPSTVQITGLTQGTTNVTIQADDGNGGTITDTFQVYVGTAQPTVGSIPAAPVGGYKTNPQIGLFSLVVPVTNTTAAPINGFNLTVDYSFYKNQPAYSSLRLYSISKPVGFGVDLIEFPHAMAVGEVVNVRLDFYTSTRIMPNPFNPVMPITSRAQPPAVPGPAAVGGVAATIRVPTPGQVLLEWASTVGQWYRLQYSADMSPNSWYDSPVSQQAASTRMQCLETGAPFTSSPPAGARFYRVVPVSPPVP